jgi:hypothetical protein
MRPVAIYIACTFICLLPSRMLSAQGGHGHHGAAGAAVPPPVVVKATVDKQKILIGQPIQLMLEATVPANAAAPANATAPATAAGNVLLWPVLDSLPHFEWVEKGKVDSVVKADGRYYRQYLTVTSFDSGSWAIPRLSFVAGNKKYFTDSVRIEVDYTKLDPGKDYNDIKDIIDIPNPFAKWIGWIVGLVAVVALALVVWLIRKKKILKLLGLGAPAAPRLTPYEEAVRGLEELEAQHMPENGLVKLYYTRLSDILRLYLSRRLGVASLAETSEELIGQLRRMPVEAGSFAEIAETLRMSDFVKFAKYEPGLPDCAHHFEVIRHFVEELEKKRREEEEGEARKAMAGA